MAKQDLSALSDKEFMKEWTSLSNQVESDRKRLREFSQEHQARERIKQLNLEPGDFALLQRAEAAGIASEEKVNG